MTLKNMDARWEAFEAWFNYNYKWFIANGHYGHTLEATWLQNEDWLKEHH